MVTNQLHFLPEFDLIYVMRDGRVAECGTYSQLMASGEDLKQLMLVHSQSSAVSASGENTVRTGDVAPADFLQ
jgi:ABC-type transport system involved in cytochrome bd biosynthesis fused ATPase/permease subunit